MKNHLKAMVAASAFFGVSSYAGDITLNAFDSQLVSKNLLHNVNYDSGKDAYYNSVGYTKYSGQSDAPYGKNIIVFDFSSIAPGTDFTVNDFNVSLLFQQNLETEDTVTLYALGLRSSADVTTADWAVAGTRIADNFLTSSTDTDVVNVEAADQSLDTYVKSNYTDVANSYLFLSLEYAGTVEDLTKHERYYIETANPNDPTVGIAPSLSITTASVPEPASFVLIAAAGAAMLFRRKR